MKKATKRAVFIQKIQKMPEKCLKNEKKRHFLQKNLLKMAKITKIPQKSALKRENPLKSALKMMKIDD